MVCRNICERLGCKPSFDYNQYIDGKKYCRRCETYFYHNGLFCPCCAFTTPLCDEFTIAVKLLDAIVTCVSYVNIIACSRINGNTIDRSDIERIKHIDN